MPPNRINAREYRKNRQKSRKGKQRKKKIIGQAAFQHLKKLAEWTQRVLRGATPKPKNPLISLNALFGNDCVIIRSDGKN